MVKIEKLPPLPIEPPAVREKRKGPPSVCTPAKKLKGPQTPVKATVLATPSKGTYKKSEKTSKPLKSLQQQKDENISIFKKLLSTVGITYKMLNSKG